MINLVRFTAKHFKLIETIHDPEGPASGEWLNDDIGIIIYNKIKMTDIEEKANKRVEAINQHAQSFDGAQGNLGHSLSDSEMMQPKPIY